MGEDDVIRSEDNDDRNREPQRHAGVEQHPEKDASQRQDAAERKVEPAAEHREREPHAHDQQNRASVEDVPEVREGEEPRRRVGPR